MATIFITGSADGLGFLAAQQLLAEGHDVVLHARNAGRAKSLASRLPGKTEILVADLSDLEACKQLARDANTFGPFDAVVNNAGVYQVSNKEILAVNTLAPYLLTCLIKKTKRIIYLSSGMHLHGDVDDLNNLSLQKGTSYSDSKLHMVMLAIAVSRRWPDVFANAVDPGWVPTKMGGKGAPDNLQKGFQTQTWLAISEEKEARVTGKYFYHQRQKRHNPAADHIASQDRLLSVCEEITGVSFPE